MMTMTPNHIHTPQVTSKAEDSVWTPEDKKLLVRYVCEIMGGSDSKGVEEVDWESVARRLECKNVEECKLMCMEINRKETEEHVEDMTKRRLAFLSPAMTPGVREVKMTTSYDIDHMDEEDGEEAAQVEVSKPVKQKLTFPSVPLLAGRMMTERQQLALALKESVTPATPTVVHEDIDEDEEEEECEDIDGVEGETESGSDCNASIEEYDVSGVVSDTKRVKVKHGAVCMPHRPPYYKMWSKSQQKAWNSIGRNPDAYYFKFLPPGVTLKEDQAWSKQEEERFIDLLSGHPVQGKWGLFSMNVPGRTGQNCLDFYLQLRRLKKVKGNKDGHIMHIEKSPLISEKEEKIIKVERRSTVKELKTVDKSDTVEKKEFNIKVHPLSKEKESVEPQKKVIEKPMVTSLTKKPVLKYSSTEIASASIGLMKLLDGDMDSSSRDRRLAVRQGVRGKTVSVVNKVAGNALLSSSVLKESNNNTRKPLPPLAQGSVQENSIDKENVFPQSNDMVTDQAVSSPNAVIDKGKTKSEGDKKRKAEVIEGGKSNGGSARKKAKKGGRTINSLQPPLAPMVVETYPMKEECLEDVYKILKRDRHELKMVFLARYERLRDSVKQRIQENKSYPLPSPGTRYTSGCNMIRYQYSSPLFGSAWKTATVQKEGAQRPLSSILNEYIILRDELKRYHEIQAESLVSSQRYRAALVAASTGSTIDVMTFVPNMDVSCPFKLNTII